MGDGREQIRNVRVADDLWAAALDAAAWRRETVSRVVRRALHQYVAATRRRRETGGPRRSYRAGADRFLSAPGSCRGQIRHIRIPDELWHAVLESVRWRGDPSASHIIRRALAQYVAGTERRRPGEGGPGGK